MYVKVDPNWTKINQSCSDRDIYFNSVNGDIILHYGEGEFVHSKTWDGLWERVSAADKRKEEVSKKKIEPIVLHMQDEDGGVSLIKITGLNASTGNPTVRREDGSVVPLGMWRILYKDMTPMRLKELEDIKKAVRVAKDRESSFEEKYRVVDVKEFAKKTWGLD